MEEEVVEDEQVARVEARPHDADVGRDARHHLGSDRPVEVRAVTSGLGEVFPFGLPVARVTRVDKDPAQPLSQIAAVPVARIESQREVLFVWSRPGHPAAPASPQALAVETPAQ